MKSAREMSSNAILSSTSKRPAIQPAGEVQRCGHKWPLLICRTEDDAVAADSVCLPIRDIGTALMMCDPSVAEGTVCVLKAIAASNGDEPLESWCSDGARELVAACHREGKQRDNATPDRYENNARKRLSQLIIQGTCVCLWPSGLLLKKWRAAMPCFCQVHCIIFQI